MYTYYSSMDLKQMDLKKRNSDEEIHLEQMMSKCGEELR